MPGTPPGRSSGTSRPSIISSTARSTCSGATTASAVPAGFFVGRVRTIDPNANAQGLFRILVEPMPGKPAWPERRFVRLGQPLNWIAGQPSNSRRTAPPGRSSGTSRPSIISSQGLFRILVEPMPGKPAWPERRFVRLGGKVQGWESHRRRKASR
jgi:hypothetical protein